MKKFKYPLIADKFEKKEIDDAVKVLRAGQFTMSKLTINFEKKFAKYIGSKYAVMVNSGSSANFLAVQALVNPARKIRIQRGDEVLIPGICWSTSLWPLVQSGLKPVFVDVEIDTLNIDIKDLEKKISKKVRITIDFSTIDRLSNA